MSFTITCNKCGAIARQIQDAEQYFPKEYFDGNQEVTDEFKTITIRSQASYNFTSELNIKCKCGNEL